MGKRAEGREMDGAHCLSMRCGISASALGMIGRTGSLPAWDNDARILHPTCNTHTHTYIPYIDEPYGQSMVLSVVVAVVFSTV
eukprot:COSAG06_NODE_1024_length_11038_cov_245.122406_5_plen_83_part_00